VLCPPPGFERNERSNREAVASVRSSGADIVFVGLGTPKQEKWYYENREGYRPAFSFPVGAGFDFLSGRVRRAPVWMRRSGLEWAWRLAREPRRMFGRYILRDRRFFPIVLRQLRAGRPSLRTPGPGAA
jgi:N-acetylglucosaminyldiphosphoundecaprenol N-acetyl-beta-D-mannosaminyltransferase